MSESVEHSYLSDTFLNVVNDFSRVRLYGLTEADRRTYDFACVFQRDWSRPLVGQTLWKHTAGIDKDIRSLVTSAQADIWAYLVRDNVKNRALLHEVVRDFRRSEYAPHLFRLKVIWVPADFDADHEESREIIARHVRESVVQDVLFNVVFGNLSAEDVRFFLGSTGRLGLDLAVLYDVATQRFLNYPDLSRRLGVSAGPLRERILRLAGSGMIWQVNDGSFYFVSLRGRVFLELIRRILEEMESGTSTPELIYILAILGLEIDEDVYALANEEKPVPKRLFGRLMQQISATQSWGIDFRMLNYVYHEWENDASKRIMR